MDNQRQKENDCYDKDEYIDERLHLFVTIPDTLSGLNITSSTVHVYYEMTWTLDQITDDGCAHAFHGMSLSIVPRWCVHLPPFDDQSVINGYTLVVRTSPDTLTIVDHASHIGWSSAATTVVRDTPLNVKSGWTISMCVRPATSTDAVDCSGQIRYCGYRGLRITKECACATPNGYGDDCGTCIQCGFVPPNYDPSKYSIIIFSCNNVPLAVGDKYKENVKRHILTAHLHDYCIRVNAGPSSFRLRHN